MDVYTMLKINRDQNILAENLQNVLMLISGQRDEAMEVQNDIQNNKWMMAGVYDDDSGLFFFREGEYQPVLNHFKELHL